MAAENKTNAQTSKNVSFLANAKTMEKTLSIFESSGSVNIRAMRDFKKYYPNVDGEKWYSFKDGFAARFNENGILHMITYNRAGGLLYSIVYYGEKKLPENVRALVKSTYYDYSITIVEEISFQQQTVYLVHLQDQSTWKILRIFNGEVDVIEDYNKE